MNNINEEYYGGQNEQNEQKKNSSNTKNAPTTLSVTLTGSSNNINSYSKKRYLFKSQKHCSMMNLPLFDIHGDKQVVKVEFFDIPTELTPDSK